MVERNRQKTVHAPEFILLVLLLISVIYVRDILIERDRSLTRSCASTLRDTKSGLDKYIQVKGTLAELHDVENADSYIREFETWQRKRKVVEEINSVCANNSFKFTTDHATKYEIKAISRGRSRCIICYTESTGSDTPEEHGVCNSQNTCRKKGTE